jgi:hypothetical protein
LRIFLAKCFVGKLLLVDAADYRMAFSASIEACTLRDQRTGAPIFLPPYAHMNATPSLAMDSDVHVVKYSD